MNVTGISAETAEKKILQDTAAVDFLNLLKKASCSLQHNAVGLQLESYTPEGRFKS